MNWKDKSLFKLTITSAEEKRARELRKIRDIHPASIHYIIHSNFCMPVCFLIFSYTENH